MHLAHAVDQGGSHRRPEQPSRGGASLVELALSEPLPASQPANIPYNFLIRQIVLGQSFLAFEENLIPGSLQNYEWLRCNIQIFLPPPLTF